MWMMGCNDGGEICLPTNSDSLSSGRKLRPLIPRTPPNPNPNSLNHHHHHHHHHHSRGVHDPNHSFFALNHHRLAMTAEQSKRELNMAHQVVVSSRWNPTPEQLQALEDLYRRGTRTPSADQIQQITSQLRRYGKIEGKNVFYWFQNHKARERQKRRRQMESCGRAEEENGHLNNLRETGNLECKESDTGGSRKTASDDVQRANSSNTANNINCSNNDNSNNSYNWGSAEGSNIDRGGRSAMAAGRGERGVGSASATSSAAAAVKTTSTSLASSTAVVTSLWMKLNDTTRELLLPNPNIIITPNTINIDDNFDFGWNATCPRLVPPPPPVLLPTSAAAGHTVRTASCLSSPPLPFQSQDLQTLQLFPLRSEEDCYNEGYEKEMERVDFASSCCMGEDDHLRPQFFEFLPLKN